MKKMLILIGAILLSNIVYCEMKDGKYSVKEEKYSFWGWKGYLNLEIKAGKIIKAEYDHENKEGKKQRDDEAYNKNMYKSKKMSPKIFTEKLEKDLIVKQSAEKIDAVAGATQSKDKFVLMSRLLIEKAEKGEMGNYILKKSKLEKSNIKEGGK